MDPLLAIALMRVEAALLRTCGSQLHKQRRGHLDPDMHQKSFIELTPCAPFGNRLGRQHSSRNRTIDLLESDRLSGHRIDANDTALRALQAGPAALGAKIKTHLGLYVEST